MFFNKIVSLKFSPVVLVWLKVRCNNHSIIELSSSERLLGFLTVNYRVEFHKYLKKLFY